MANRTDSKAKSKAVAKGKSKGIPQYKEDMSADERKAFDKARAETNAPLASFPKLEAEIIASCPDKKYWRPSSTGLTLIVRYAKGLVVVDGEVCKAELRVLK